MKREQSEPQVHIAHDDETEKLRQWWKRNGTGIIAGIVIGIGGVGGIQGWRMYQDGQAAAASSLYEAMLAGASANDAAALSAAARELIDDHPGSGYADLARLMLARQAYADGSTDRAETALTEVLEKSADPVMQQVAKVRLAVLALERGDIERIRQLADSGAADGFVSQFQELLGDALAAAGDLKAAAQAYEKALANVAPNSQAARLINAKLNMTRRDEHAG